MSLYLIKKGGQVNCYYWSKTTQITNLHKVSTNEKNNLSDNSNTFLSDSNYPSTHSATMKTKISTVRLHAGIKWWMYDRWIRTSHLILVFILICFSPNAEMKSLTVVLMLVFLVVVLDAAFIPRLRDAADDAPYEQRMRAYDVFAKRVIGCPGNLKPKGSKCTGMSQCCNDLQCKYTYQGFQCQWWRYVKTEINVNLQGTGDEGRQNKVLWC